MHDINAHQAQIMKTEYCDHDPAYNAKETWYFSPEQLAVFRECPARFRRWQSRGDEPTEFCMLVQALRSQLSLATSFEPTTLPRSLRRLVLRMHESITGQAVAKKLLSHAVVSPVLRAQVHRVPGQARLDWLVAQKRLVRLVVVPSLVRFESQVWSRGEVHALALQQVLCELVLKKSPAALLLGVESNEPFRCGLWEVSPATLAVARRDNEDTLDRLIAFHTYNLWPTGYEQIRTLDLS